MTLAYFLFFLILHYHVIFFISFFYDYSSLLSFVFHFNEILGKLANSKVRILREYWINEVVVASGLS